MTNPEVNKESEAILKEQHKQELITRIKNGHVKLQIAMTEISTMAEGDEKKETLKIYRSKTTLIKNLNAELVSLGFKDCLYIIAGVKTKKCLEGCFCHACPAQVGLGRAYWEEELFDTPKIRGKK